MRVQDAPSARGEGKAPSPARQSDLPAIQVGKRQGRTIRRPGPAVALPVRINAVRRKEKGPIARNLRQQNDATQGLFSRKQPPARIRSPEPHPRVSAPLQRPREGSRSITKVGYAGRSARVHGDDESNGRAPTTAMALLGGVLRGAPLRAAARSTLAARRARRLGRCLLNQSLLGLLRYQLLARLLQELGGVRSLNLAAMEKGPLLFHEAHHGTANERRLLEARLGHRRRRSGRLACTIQPLFIFHCHGRDLGGEFVCGLLQHFRSGLLALDDGQLSIQLCLALKVRLLRLETLRLHAGQSVRQLLQLCASDFRARSEIDGRIRDSFCQLTKRDCPLGKKQLRWRLSVIAAKIIASGRGEVAHLATVQYQVISGRLGCGRVVEAQHEASLCKIVFEHSRRKRSRCDAHVFGKPLDEGTALLHICPLEVAQHGKRQRRLIMNDAILNRNFD